MNWKFAERCGLSLALLLIGSGDAMAAAIAGVSSNRVVFLSAFGVTTDGTRVGFGQTGLEIHLLSSTPSLTKTETGNATVDFATSGVGISGRATADNGGYAIGTYSITFQHEFANTSENDYAYLQLYVDFSAFNPGGPAVGASVDNSNFEFARFASSQSGSRLFDSHSCDTRIVTYHTFDPPPGTASCGVQAPDSSTAEFVFLNLGAGESQTRTFTLRLELEVYSAAVPAPPVAALLLLAISLLGWQARTRRQF